MRGVLPLGLPAVRLANKNLLLSVDVVVGLEPLATTLADKHTGRCCQIVCWLDIHKNLKAWPHTLQGWTLSFLCALSPHTFFPTLVPSSNNMNSLTNIPSTSSGLGARRWAPLFMSFLKLILVLKAIYQMRNLFLLPAINLARYLSCSIFEGRMAPWTTNMSLDRLESSLKFLPEWLHCSGKQGGVASGRWSGALGITRYLWCWVFMWLFNFFLLERTMKQELQEWQQGPCPLPPPGFAAYPPHPSVSSSSS